MRFSDIYKSKSAVFSLELFPPKDPNQLSGTLELVRRLAEDLSPDFMTVTYGAGGGTRELTRSITSYIASNTAAPAVAHLTCIGHTQVQIDELLDQYGASGVKHILALRGDKPSGSSEFVKTPGGFGCARDLTAHISARGDFSVAVAGYPERHPDAGSWEDEIGYLKQKIDSGGEVILTQLFFEPDIYFRFREMCIEAGISAPIVPGVMPIGNFGQLKRFTSLCGASVPQAILSDLEGRDEAEVKKYGTDWAIRQCRSLLQGGAPGIHFYTLNRSSQVEVVMRELR